MIRAALIVFGALVLVGLYLSAALAHMAPTGWEYPAWCCGGNDCAPIAAANVRTSPDGYVVTLGKGDHPMKSETTTFVIPYANAKPSPDGDYHLCLYPNEFSPHCFYAGSMAF